jgi:hypothetical protein
MSLFQILERHPVTSSDAGVLDTIVVQDRFHALAAIFPPLWALYHHMWVEALAWLVLALALNLLGLVLGGVTFWLYVLFALWCGYEAHNLWVRALRRKNYTDQGTLIALNLELAEMEWVKHTLSKVVQTPDENPILSGAEA